MILTRMEMLIVMMKLFQNILVKLGVRLLWENCMEKKDGLRFLVQDMH